MIKCNYLQHKHRNTYPCFKVSAITFNARTEILIIINVSLMINVNWSIIGNSWVLIKQSALLQTFCPKWSIYKPHCHYQNVSTLANRVYLIAIINKTPLRNRNCPITNLIIKMGVAHTVGPYRLNHIASFASIYPIPTSICIWQRELRISLVENLSLFVSAILNFSFDFWFLCFTPIQISHNLWATKDGMKFWWLPWFPAKTRGI